MQIPWWRWDNDIYSYFYNQGDGEKVPLFLDMKHCPEPEIIDELVVSFFKIGTHFNKQDWILKTGNQNKDDLWIINNIHHQYQKQFEIKEDRDIQIPSSIIHLINDDYDNDNDNDNDHDHRYKNLHNSNNNIIVKLPKRKKQNKNNNKNNNTEIKNDQHMQDGDYGEMEEGEKEKEFEDLGTFYTVNEIYPTIEKLSCRAKTVLWTLYKYKQRHDIIEEYSLSKEETKKQFLKEETIIGNYFQSLYVTIYCCDPSVRLCNVKTLHSQNKSVSKKKKNQNGILDVEFDTQNSKLFHCLKHFKKQYMLETIDIKNKLDRLKITTTQKLQEWEKLPSKKRKEKLDTLLKQFYQLFHFSENEESEICIEHLYTLLNQIHHYNTMDDDEDDDDDDDESGNDEQEEEEEEEEGYDNDDFDREMEIDQEDQHEDVEDEDEIMEEGEEKDEMKEGEEGEEEKSGGKNKKKKNKKKNKTKSPLNVLKIIRYMNPHIQDYMRSIFYHRFNRLDTLIYIRWILYKCTKLPTWMITENSKDYSTYYGSIIPQIKHSIGPFGGKINMKKIHKKKIFLPLHSSSPEQSILDDVIIYKKDQNLQDEEEKLNDLSIIEDVVNDYNNGNTNVITMKEKLIVNLPITTSRIECKKYFLSLFPNKLRSFCKKWFKIITYQWERKYFKDRTEGVKFLTIGKYFIFNRGKGEKELYRVCNQCGITKPFFYSTTEFCLHCKKIMLRNREKALHIKRHSSRRKKKRFKIKIFANESICFKIVKK